MIINGTLDTSLDSDYLAVPTGIKWPAPLAKLIPEYETAWLNYNAAQIELLDAHASLDDAEAADTRALIEAVTAGEPHPGHKHTATAQDDARYKEEVTRQAARKADKLADQIRAAATEHRANLTTQTVALERQSIVDLATAYSHAQAIITKAQLDAQIIGSRVNWIAAVTDPGNSNRLHVSIPEVAWPAAYTLNQLNQSVFLDTLEAAQADHTARTK